jgi:acetyl-CoA carboxylase, biotin carboxylase subunit
LHKILIANRGEIAVRVVRACRDLGLGAVAVFSECDRAARHVRMADEAVALGGNAPADSYLRIDRIIHAAQVTGADAVHPGYGFLSENADFASACRDAGLTFIGPTPEAVARVGSKTTARQIARSAGVPVVTGTEMPFGPDAPVADLADAAARIGYPVLIKAVAGGGGKGMRVVGSAEDLQGAIRLARSEAATAFGDSSVYLERFLQRPRHVEIQILADHHGNIRPFVERECSIQRRHQKVVEESPSPAVDAGLRTRLADAAVAVAKKAGYTNAGTVEFLVDEDGHFYFLEVNARLQVEHPVTELVCGVDLVQWQIRIARGERLTLSSDDTLTPNGHAIECRVYAEDPDLGFLPSPGPILALRAPHGPGVRDDGWAEPGTDVPIYYDSLLSKVSVWGRDRAQATARMRRALGEYEIGGVRSTLPFSRWLLARSEFVEARFHTGFLDELLQQRAGEPFAEADSSLEEVAAVAACLVEASSYAKATKDRSTSAKATVDRSTSAKANTSLARELDEPDLVHGGSWKARARKESLRR